MKSRCENEGKTVLRRGIDTWRIGVCTREAEMQRIPRFGVAKCKETVAFCGHKWYTSI